MIKVTDQDIYYAKVGLKTVLALFKDTEALKKILKEEEIIAENYYDKEQIFPPNKATLKAIRTALKNFNQKDNGRPD